jgi:hypothetical protein
MMYRWPCFLAVVWLGSSPTPPLPFIPVSHEASSFPLEIHENLKKNRIKIILDRKRLLPVSRKIQTKEPPAIVFFCSVGTLIQSGYIESSVTTQKLFFCLKGSGYFKKSEKIAEMLRNIRPIDWFPSQLPSL